eukprot:Rmarinus@m.13646
MISLDPYKSLLPKSYAEKPDANPTPDEIAEHAKTLGIRAAYEPELLWIAEAALRAALPKGWSEYKDSSTSNVYFHNTASGISTWDHPMEAHFKRLVKEQRAMKGKTTQEQSNPAGPKLLTPEDVKNMAQYLGVDPIGEVHLLALCKYAVLATLPEGWEEKYDQNGNPYYISKETGKMSKEHPNDRRVLRKIGDARIRYAEMGRPRANPWLQFTNVMGQKYWYNFETEESDLSPAENLKVEGGWLCKDGKTYEVGFDPREAVPSALSGVPNPGETNKKGDLIGRRDSVASSVVSDKLLDVEVSANDLSPGIGSAVNLERKKKRKKKDGREKDKDRAQKNWQQMEAEKLRKLERERRLHLDVEGNKHIANGRKVILPSLGEGRATAPEAMTSSSQLMAPQGNDSPRNRALSGSLDDGVTPQDHNHVTEI